MGRHNQSLEVVSQTRSHAEERRLRQQEKIRDLGVGRDEKSNEK